MTPLQKRDLLIEAQERTKQIERAKVSLPVKMTATIIKDKLHEVLTDQNFITWTLGELNAAK